MNKHICDICGTSYPSTAESCPICGYSTTDAEDLLTEEVAYEEYADDQNAYKAGSRKKEIFDFDEVNTESDPDEDEDEDEEEEEEEEEDYDEEEEEEAPRHNTFVVILLTILIVALLGAAAFIYIRFFRPNMEKEETVPTTAYVQEKETTAPATEPTVPCQHMAMTNAGVAELNAEGQQFLLHIKALPEDTTDPIIYISANESVATVTEDGKITAVSEGETVITISCGKQSIECPVIVKYVEETVPPTTEAPVETEPSETEEDTEDTEESEEPVDEAEEEQQTPAVNSNIQLKLNRYDIQLGVYYEFRLVLECDLAPEDVVWTSEHPHIATVDEQGNVTAIKAGTTSVSAKYGDQEVSCIVRCVTY